MIDINPVERGYYIKVRGMENVLIQPKSETRRAVFQQSTTQTCVVNQIRNSCKHVVWKVMREFSADMKEIYTSVNRDQRDYLYWSDQYTNLLFTLNRK